MKKVLFVAILAFASVMAYAQPRAIGGRLGAFNGVSYEHGFGDSNMLEIEAGLGFAGRSEYWLNGYSGRMWGHSVQAAVTYDWIDPFGAKFPWEHKGEWHWYLGVGGAGGYVFNNAGFIGAAGRAGVEYDFWFPLQLSIDFRPVVGAGLWNGGAGCYWEATALALVVRYNF